MSIAGRGEHERDSAPVLGLGAIPGDAIECEEDIDEETEQEVCLGLQRWNMNGVRS